MTAADSTPGSSTPADPTPVSAPAGGATADDTDASQGDRPGDIPFDQATAEHENPDLA
ncbi:hypothetical protein G3T36_09175 [Diaminobutyricibacter tongyongensis]|uniref:Uncharacterized protein n=1 Tax=Leifsonia tongyongensis TaxID=1268043 RepID=A0A6L9XXN4_9MICO|nr:hypothetical protein [Diaminobutyricibacter tongyongensis]NEN06046.1 hypothetical protein [Diaminobutyricibacter tongyongensis]